MAQTVSVSGISLQPAVLNLLRNAARGRQRAMGGRASVSALVSELVMRHEQELKEMAKGKIVDVR